MIQNLKNKKSTQELVIKKTNKFPYFIIAATIL